jgi:type I restriction enzyme S subunit
VKPTWTTRRLEEVAELVNGRAFKPAEWQTEGMQIVRIQNLNDPSAPYNYHPGPLPEKYRVHTGDILLSWSGTPGTSFGCFEWAGSDAWLNQHIFNVRLSPDVVPAFFVHQLNSKLSELIAKAHGGVGLQHVTKGVLDKLSLVLPPVPEQYRIASLLDEADELRRRREQADRRTTDLVPALFYDMFGEPLKGQLRWDCKTLGDVLSDIDSGWSPTCADRVAATDEWGVLKLGAVTSCKYLEGENKALPGDVEPRPDLEVKAGDILFTRKNTHELVAACAHVATTRPRLMLSDLIFRLRISGDAEVIPDYLWALMVNASMRKKVQRLASGSAGSMPNISKQRLRGVSIPVPPLLLQGQFAARVAEIRALEARQAESRRRLDDLFQSMLHRAFEGEL